MKNKQQGSCLQYLHQIFMKMLPRQTALIARASSFMMEGGRQVRASSQRRSGAFETIVIQELAETAA